MEQHVTVEARTPHKLRILGSIPFVIVHLVAFSAFFLDVSAIDIVACAILYVTRFFGITAGYHRYFAHRSYKTSRAFQFVLACLGSAAAQRGPLWWAAHHRHHHRTSDTPEDLHSPIVDGLLWSHLGWIVSQNNYDTNFKLIKDFAKFPELRFINKHHYLIPGILMVCVAALGYFLQHSWGFNTTPWQFLCWGFFVSTVISYHATFCVNSLTHLIGKQHLPTKDKSKNSFLLAIFTFGEGWHNNHHYYPASERQGWLWWEIDISHYMLVFLSWFGLVWDLNGVPERLLSLKKAALKKAQLDPPSAIS